MRCKFFVLSVVTLLCVQGFWLVISPVGASSKDNSDWHAGTNVTLPELTITYEEEYGIAEFSTGSRDRLTQTMTVSYLDGTGVKQGFQILIWFESGGLDVPNKKVVDWDKVMSIEPTVFTDSPDAKGINVAARHVFSGFTIFKGTTASLYFENQTSTSGTFMSPKQGTAGAELAQITMANATCKLSSVSVTGKIYEYKGSTYNATELSYSVNLNATMGNFTHSSAFPMQLDFRMKHNATESSYKYGVNMDWSSQKNFTTDGNAPNTGDGFFLLSNDLMEVFHGSDTHKQFEATADNSTTIYKNGTQELCRQDLVKTFDIKGGSSGVAAKFYYFANGRYDEGLYGSNIFVAYDGFKYNQSTGMSYDPVFTVPCSIQNDGSSLGDIDGFGAGFVILSSLATVIVLGTRKVKKNHH